MIDAFDGEGEEMHRVRCEAPFLCANATSVRVQILLATSTSGRLV